MDFITAWNAVLRPDVELSRRYCEEFAAAMRARKLTFGDRVHCPFLRPFFLTEADASRMRAAAETIASLGERVTAAALAANPEIDAAWGTDGCTGIIQAFLQANRPLVPMTGHRNNGFMRLAAEKNIPTLVIGQTPAMLAVAIRAAVALLDGQKLPKEISLPLEEIPTSDMKAGVNYFPELPDSFNTDVSVPACDVQIRAEMVQ